MEIEELRKQRDIAQSEAEELRRKLLEEPKVLVFHSVFLNVKSFDNKYLSYLPFRHVILSFLTIIADIEATRISSRTIG